MLKCPKCEKTLNSFVTICPNCNYNIAEYYQLNEIKYSLEDKIKMYTKNINGHNINIMDLFIKNKEDLKKTIKELAKLTEIDNYHAKKFVNEFYRKYIKVTDIANKYQEELNKTTKK